MAYYIGLKPVEFWNLSPREFHLMIKAHTRKNEIEMQRMALLASWITAPHYKKPMTIDKYLSKKHERKQTTPEETKRVLSELIHEIH